MYAYDSIVVVVRTRSIPRKRLYVNVHDRLKYRAYP